MTDKAYKLPSDLNPTGIREFCIQLPDDIEWWRTFWGAFYLLTYWWSFEKDPEHKAKDVAAKWLEFYQLNHDRFSADELCGDGDMPFYLRINPDNECESQFSNDNENWTTFATNNCCCDETPLLPNPPADTPVERDKDAGIVIDRWHKWLAGKVDEHGNKTDFLNDVMGTLAPYNPNPATRAALGDVYTKGKGKPEYAEDCIYIDPHDNMAGEIDGNDNWLNELADNIIDWLNGAADDVINALNLAAATIKGEDLAAFIGSGETESAGFAGGAGFGGECGEWSHTFDFLIDDQDWGNIDHPDYGTQNGSWDAWGYHTNDFASGTRVLYIFSPFTGVPQPAIEFTKITLDYYLTGSATTHTIEVRTSDSIILEKMTTNGAATTPFVTGIRHVSPHVWVGATIDNVPGGIGESVVIRSIIVEGRGIDPF